MINVGNILNTLGCVQYHWGYHDVCGGYHEYDGGPGGVQYCGGQSFAQLSTPTVLNTLHNTHDIPHGTQITQDGIPPWY